ncbi:MAG: tRNA lysidine(34) synthetase TilS [Lachnospiraceae bacterium]|nr:tRNA lysidine(34) synthetase TilS [Lachnospiraceae bacterium]
MTTRNKIIDFCREKKLLDIGDGLLIGLSGGADSVCLLFILHSLKDDYGLRLHALHVNHGIRGEEAEQDERFCRELCEKLGVEFETVRADIPALAEKEGMGLEEAGRRFRYETFERKAAELGLNKIAVAHHMNDRAETALFQLIRGSRLKGLAGVKERNGQVIRPLLCVTRNEIEEYLKENGLGYVTDSTNLSADYTRNRLRNTVIPELEKICPRAAEHMAETADYLGRVADYMEKEADKVREKAVRNENGNQVLSIPELRKADPLLAETVIYNAICEAAGRKKDITGNFVKMVTDLMERQSGRSVDIKYGVTAKRVYETIVLSRSSLENAVDTTDGNCNNRLCVEIWSVAEGKAPDLIESMGGHPKGNLKKYFDYDRLLARVQKPFTAEDFALRTAEATDVMAIYPDGKSKKVFDILKDEKVEAEKRNLVPVAALGSEVLIIKGIRSCETCRVDEKTKNILSVTITEE